MTETIWSCFVFVLTESSIWHWSLLLASSAMKHLSNHKWMPETWMSGFRLLTSISHSGLTHPSKSCRDTAETQRAQRGGSCSGRERKRLFQIGWRVCLRRSAHGWSHSCADFHIWIRSYRWEGGVNANELDKQWWCVCCPPSQKANQNSLSPVGERRGDLEIPTICPSVYLVSSINWGKTEVSILV